MPRATRGNTKRRPPQRTKELKSQRAKRNDNDNNERDFESTLVPEDKSRSNPSQSISTSKTKKTQKKYSETEKSKIQDQVMKMQESPATSNLLMETLLARVPINRTSYY